MSNLKRCLRACIAFIAILGGCAPCAALSTGRSVSAICDSAAAVAARETGVPIDVLRAISLTETGRESEDGFQSWPWTVNMEGVGKWFDDIASAQHYVDRHFARGARSFDVGCFQINFKWHGAAFKSLEDMFDPVLNARYAARFLADLHGEYGDWSEAAGAYHSRTPKYARRYMARFDRIRKGLSATPSLETEPDVSVTARRTQAKPDAPNLYPLLQPGGPKRDGSLVPLANSGASLLIVSGRRPFLETR